MSVQVEELYLNLNKLLTDICNFLSDERKLDKLSPLNRKEADELIKKSKIQLQEIARISPEKSEYDGAYVDMERKSVTNDNEENKHNIYMYVEAISKPTSIIKNGTCPFEVPAKELHQVVKKGYLSWKIKFILNFEKMKRIYCVIQNNWLLVYSHKNKDTKPSHSFDLNFYIAKTIENKQGKCSQDFELISLKADKKSYYFAADYNKDMLQWIAHINRSHHSSSPLQTEDDNYDSFANLQKNTENDDEEAIYQEPSFTNANAKKFDVPPDLPSRPLPIMKQPSVESIVSYDPVEPSISDEPLVTTESSFSSDEEDDIYESFISVKQEIQMVMPEIKPRHLLFVKKTSFHDPSSRI